MKKQIRLIAFASIPLLACILFAACQGMALWQIDPYASLWNDEVFYYKQIEGMVHSGAPLGFFGYNGSFAEVGTLGAWPVFLLYPYALLGMIFGISPYHMIVFNILLMMFAFGVFYYLAKPDKWQSVAIFLLFMTFPALPRYLMSGMVESLFHMAAVLLTGFLIYFQKGDYGKVSLAMAYLLVLYFSLCRPWFLIFIVIPGYYHFRKNKKGGVAVSLLTIVAFALLYVGYVMPRCAEYLYSTLNLGLFSTLVTKGPFAFLKEVVTTTWTDGMTLIGFLFSFKTFYAASLFSLLILLVMLAVCAGIRKKQQKTWKDEKLITAVVAVLIVICIVWAIVLFYTEEQASRHVMSLILGLQMLFVMYYLPKRREILAGVIILLALVGWQYYGDGYTFVLPQTGGAGSILKEEAKQLETAFVPEDVTEENTAWENTVLYVYPNVNTNYCYYLPKGCGVNLCIEPYINEVYAATQARYILTSYDEGTYSLYREAGWSVRAQGQGYVLYEKE